MSVGEQQSPEQSPSESQGEVAQAFREMSENRWLPDNLPSLIDDENIQSNGGPSNNLPAPPSGQQALPPPPQVQHSHMPNPPLLRENAHPMDLSQPGAGYQTTASLPVTVAEPPKDQPYTQRNDHTGIPQMILTNFKIEFTCATCGSLNQSFFPNQGNVTGAGYLPHHAVPNPSHVARHPGPAPQNGVGNNNNTVGEDETYDVNAATTPTIQNAWAAGGLGVPIGPTHT
jgi:hypothetical protein